MPRDLSVKNPELRKENKVNETVEQETENQQDTPEHDISPSYWAKQPAKPDTEDDLPIEWERADGLKVIQTKKTSFMVITPDGTELRGPKGRLRTWRNMEKVQETLDIEHPLR